MQWLIVLQEKPEDFVIGTGVQYTMRKFVEDAAKEFGMQIRWEGSGETERGYDDVTGRCIVTVDDLYFRPTEVGTVPGDATKAQHKLGWMPKISFAELVSEKSRSDMLQVEFDVKVKTHGLKALHNED